MLVLKDIHNALPVPCPYLDGEEFTQQYFFAAELSFEEMDILLSKGWRRFGLYFFKPVCLHCQKCIPIRIPCESFFLSKSQRRVVRKNQETRFEIGPLRYFSEMFSIYKKHSLVRFNNQVNEKEFQESFYTASSIALQSEYYVGDKLVGGGFLDRGLDSLSTVYFFFDPDYQHLGLGTYSILKEIEWAGLEGLRSYYLGYYIEKNKSMAYKGHFKPHELYDWKDESWKRESDFKETE